jgi:hypothetical protein
MTMHRMLAATGVLLLIAVAGCGSSPADTNTDETATATPPALPDLPPPAADGAEGQSPLASRLVPTFKGEAQLGYLLPTARIQGSTRVTSMTVKNLNNAAIAGLTVDEIGVDKANAQVSRTKTFRYPSLKPGEVIEVMLELPIRPGMVNTRYEFAHANGTIKPVLLKTVDDAP